MDTAGQANMPLLITGANSPLARAFIHRHRDLPVYALDVHFDEPIAGARQIVGDPRDAALLDDLLDEVTSVVHLAPFVTALSSSEGTSSSQEALAHIVQGAYQLAKSFAEKDHASHFVMAGTSDLYGDLWTRYRIDERWRPRLTPEPPQLFPYLAEMMLKEVARVTGLPAICLRMGTVFDDDTAASMRNDPHRLHIEDAVAAIENALAADHRGWGVYHIGSKGEHAAIDSTFAAKALSYYPRHEFSAPWRADDLSFEMPTIKPIPPREIRRVAIFGAGGPLGSAITSELAGDYVLHLSDVKPIDELACAEPQSIGAPLPCPLQPPHIWETIDIRNIDQVMAACADVDAIINCSVVRQNTAMAFEVNMVGAYNVMKAAVAHGIHRVVHTGPFMLGDRGAFGYNWDYRVVDDVPPRPGIGWVYLPSKMAAQEICRTFAEHYGLSVPVLAFCQFASPDDGKSKRLHPLAVSWEDAGRAARAALEVAELPHPYEYFHIGTELPHGVYDLEKVHRILGWQAVDSLERFYLRPLV